MTKKLIFEPCPFCGQKPNRYWQPLSFTLSMFPWRCGFYVSCKCGARGPLRTSKQRAIDAWNVRVHTHMSTTLELNKKTKPKSGGN